MARIDTETLRSFSQTLLDPALTDIPPSTRAQARVILRLCDELDRIRNTAAEVVEAIEERGAYEGSSTHDMALMFCDIAEGGTR